MSALADGVRRAPVDTKRVLLWHVHGSYTTALLEGRHTYYLPTLPDRGPDGRGRARTWDWPGNAVEITPAQAREIEFDVAIAQRPAELAELVEDWTGRKPPGIFPRSISNTIHRKAGSRTCVIRPPIGATWRSCT